MIDAKISYFQEAGEINTDDCIKIVKERLSKGDIKKVVIASSSGETALRLKKEISADVICVTYNAGFGDGKYKQIFDSNIAKLQEQGIKYCRGTHALSAGERSINKSYGGAYPLLIIADTLRRFSQGVKVAVEVSLSATDNGLVEEGERIISIGGSGSGCDSALVLSGTYSHNLLQKLEIFEMLCMSNTQ